MNEGLGRGYEDLWDCELKSMAKSLSVVEQLGPNAENAFMVEHPGGARHFYGAEGILLANLSAQWKLHEVLGEFDTWDEFEELAGISVGIFYDACPTCKRQSMYFRETGYGPCKTCTSVGGLVSGLVSELVN